MVYGAWLSREPSHVLAYTDRGDAGTQTTQSTVIHSPGAFEKADETKPYSRNINQDQNSAARMALPSASEAGSHPRAAWP